MQSNPLYTQHYKADSVPQSSTSLVARLRITADPAESLLVNPRNALAFPFGEGSPFIIAQNAQQRPDGLAVAIIGEPGIVTESATEEIKRVDASELLDLYETWGSGCVEKLRGSWAIAIADPGQNRVLLASDRMGRQPLYFRIGRDSVLVGSSLDSLREFAGATTVDAQILYNYTYFHVVPAPGAVIERFHKLGAAQRLELTPEGHCLTRYWNPEFSENTARPVASAQAELRTRLKTAVSRCAFGYGDAVEPGTEAGGSGIKVGAFLSGGLDSSTVAGMLSELQGGSCDAYAIGFDAEGYDEMAFARLTSKHFGIRLHEYYVTADDVVQALPGIAAAFDEPFGNSSALPAYFCARMAAEDGIDTLLAGDGGDELFAGNARYARQAIFDIYRRSPRWLRSRLVEPVLAKLPSGLPLVEKARSFILQANTPLPERLQHYSFLEQNAVDTVFRAEFLQQVDQTMPLNMLREIYQKPENASPLNRMLYMDWQITLADNDLRKVNQACALANVNVRYPMLDDDLVEFSTTIPSAWKLPGNTLKGSKLRHFYKQSLTGWLPEATINKRKHGFGLPFGLWMKDHKPLQELAYDNILGLKNRGIFLPAFLDQSIAMHRQGHAAYFGELIWVLMSLELWLAANQPDYVLEKN